MLDCNWHHHVLEGILVFSLNGQHRAEMLVIMLPEDPIFDRLEPVEQWLHGNGRQTVELEAFCMHGHVRLSYHGCIPKAAVLTLLGPLSATLPDLFLGVTFTNHGILFTVHAYTGFRTERQPIGIEVALTPWLCLVTLLLALPTSEAACLGSALCDLVRRDRRRNWMLAGSASGPLRLWLI